MDTTCAVCKVTTDVPEQASAYKCPNCGAQLRLRGDGTSRRPFPFIKVVLPLLVVLVFVTCIAASH